MEIDAKGMAVGVIGLGAMGLGIAQSLRRSKFEVRVFDVRREAAESFARDGGRASATAAELAAACDVVVSAVVSAAQTDEVLFGAGGAAAAMRRGSAFMMCSTVDPNWSSALEGRLEERGLLYLDSPMSGGAAKAAAGELTMMTSGRPAAYAKCQPVLDAMAAKVYRLGDRAGAGSKVKTIHQLLAGVHIAAAAEAMALGLREGVDPQALYEVITHSAGNSWMFGNRMAHVLAGDYTPLSSVDIFVKDLGLVLDLARASKFPLPLASTAHQMFMQASSAGHAKEDDSAVIKIFPGIELPEKGEVTLRLGCIADDLTGATDVALMLQNAGMRTVQAIGVPAGNAPQDVDAVVVALKSRTSPPAEAVAQSLAALAWLRGQGAGQILFKYCSTFDSTDAGNIGPVADALLDALGAAFTVACPAFPTNKRTIYQGHLFVGEQLLSDSPMKDHPLTPMRDASLVRVLGRQTKRKVGLVALPTVRQGAGALREAFAALERAGHGYAIVDAVADEDLLALGAACRDMALLTGGSGIAMGLPANFGISKVADAGQPAVGGHAAVLSGSCSAQSNVQVAHWLASHPGFRVDPLRLAAGEDLAAAALAWAQPRLAAGPVLVYATAEPAAVRAAQAQLGSQRAGDLVEQCLAQIARGLVAQGVRRLVVAGGETSGAVVNALGVRALRIGPQIDPGVPWTSSIGEPRLALALKSGNFGAVDFFDKALGMQA